MQRVGDLQREHDDTLSEMRSRLDELRKEKTVSPVTLQWVTTIGDICFFFGGRKRSLFHLLSQLTQEIQHQHSLKVSELQSKISNLDMKNRKLQSTVDF